MNLIDIFESKPFQDVGTFNSVFKTTPILGFAPDLEVVIGSMTSTGRRLSVGGKEIILSLAVNKKEQQLRAKVTRKSAFNKPKQTDILSSIYKELSPSEFMLYSAIKELGTVYGISQVSRLINLTSKTCAKTLKTLQEKNLVKVSGDYCGMSKIVLTREIK
jgi:DNA-binding MarR family transcriptional regulator